MAVKDGLPATDFSRKDREWVKNVVDGTTVPDGLPATDLSRMNREWVKAVVDEAGGGGGGDITVESLTVTENDTYTAPEGKAYSPVIVNVPVGGPGSFELLDTITVAEAVNAIKLDINPAWNVYDMLYIEADTVFDAQDYLYLDFDSMSPTHYQNKAAQHWFIAIISKSGNSWTATIPTGTGHQTFSGYPDYLSMKAYDASHYFTTATTITIHGGKLS